MFTVRYRPHTLQFKFAAGTSRGVMREKTSWYIMLEKDGKTGIGEAGPLAGLSIDDRPDFEDQLRAVCVKLEKTRVPESETEAERMAADLCGEAFPSIRFAMETALRDWLKGGRRLIFDNYFSRGEGSIPINGLIWMGDKNTMRERMQEKLEQGYSCLKMKIGAIHFEEECAILAEVRRHFPASEITLRVDANGAFTPEEVMKKLEQLAKYELHSIEQPIKAGQLREMARICRESPIPVALDEELIGVPVLTAGKELLQQIRPSYIILKPGLLGGMAVCRQWMSLAGQQGADYWITSALESNIGLNAISQFTAQYPVNRPQGLGTGQLYENNIPSPLRIEKGMLRYEPEENWNLDLIS